MSAGTLRALVVLAAAGTLVLSAASVLLIALTPGVDPLLGWGFVGYDALFAVVYLAIGLLITARRPENLIGWLFLLAAVLSGIQTATASYAAYAPTAGAPAGEVFRWINVWIWIPAVAVIVLTLLLYPNGRPASPRWRGATLALLPVAATVTVLWALAAPEDPSVGAPFAFDPLGLAPDHPLRSVAGMSLLALAAWLLVAAASLDARMRRGDAVERQQVKWLAFAAALLAPTLAASIVTTLVPGDPLLAKVTQVAAITATLLIPVAAAVAILRYRLYEIDVLINRTLVYGALTATLGAAYVGSVLLLQTVLRPFTAENEIAVAVSTLAVVALFQPLRRRIQDWVDRRFYRSRYDAQRTLDAFAGRLRDQVDLGSLERELVGVVAETVRPRHASLWLRDSRD